MAKGCGPFSATAVPGRSSTKLGGWDIPRTPAGGLVALVLMLALSPLLALSACSSSTRSEACDGQADCEVPPEPLIPRPVTPAVCGNGALESGEACDDGNTDDGDGCSGDCLTVEDGFVCPLEDEACIVVTACGNGIVEGDEACDDGNRRSGDGCRADCLAIEDDFVCPVPGQACVSTIVCGDGVVSGQEGCDDGNEEPGDGCNERCRLESGFKCPTPGMPCEETVCGDNIVEGTEQCDDGNNDTGDGCNPLCESEPDCTGGVCTPICGDGVKLPQEECDDGNTQDGDGCSSICELEEGFQCVDMTPAPPEQIQVPIVYRDFLPWGACPNASRAENDTVCTAEGPKGHPDFERFNGSNVSPRIVQTYLNETTGKPMARLRADGKPYYSRVPTITPNLPYGTQLNTVEAFEQWYRDTENINVTHVERLSLDREGDSDVYQFDSGAGFFPLTGRGWQAPTETANNFHFTSELRYWFQYAGGEELTFSGDDDVWVFIDRRLTVDVGGLHPSQTRSVTLDENTEDAEGDKLGLVVGGIYEVALFHAERRTTQSNYRLTLGGFNAPVTSCEFVCGDSITTPQEACDDGINDGSYGSCDPDCMGFAPSCGDGVVQEGVEECDFGRSGNVGGYNGCNPDCTRAPSCGDGVLAPENGETCDDGNLINDDGCSAECTIERTGPILE